MDTIYGGQETTFCIVTIPEDATSFAEFKQFMGKPILQITGVSANKSGGYARPMLSFTISLNGEALTFDFSAVTTRLALNISAEFIEGA